ncbi:MAG TPA: DUF2919 family protein [Steroidobacteraceae bacterium]|nr:DUF2919 family protein [Steroidobacteraceae bacterium]
MRRYGLDDYNGDLCLKPPLLLWIAMLYLSRGILLFVLSTTGSMAALSSDAVTLLRGSLSPEMVIPSVMAAAVLCALLRRMPSASKPVRWIWTNGQFLLAAAALADLVLQLLDSPLLRGDTYDQPAWPLVAATVDLYFLAYVFASRRVRDVFADFPAPAGASG